LASKRRVDQDGGSGKKKQRTVGKATFLSKDLLQLIAELIGSEAYAWMSRVCKGWRRFKDLYQITYCRRIEDGWASKFCPFMHSREGEPVHSKYRDRITKVLLSDIDDVQHPVEFEETIPPLPPGPVLREVVCMGPYGNRGVNFTHGRFVPTHHLALTWLPDANAEVRLGEDLQHLTVCPSWFRFRGFYLRGLVQRLTILDGEDQSLGIPRLRCSALDVPDTYVNRVATCGLTWINRLEIRTTFAEIGQTLLRIIFDMCRPSSPTHGQAYRPCLVFPENVILVMQEYCVPMDDIHFVALVGWRRPFLGVSA